MIRVLVFGTFDPLHSGHEYLFQEAKKLGEKLIVVVARDIAIQQEKHRQNYMSEQDRLRVVQQNTHVDTAILGDESPQAYATLKNLDFEIVALGYDQRPSDDETRRILDSIGKQDVKIVRLASFKPEEFKSSFFRNT